MCPDPHIKCERIRHRNHGGKRAWVSLSPREDDRVMREVNTSGSIYCMTTGCQSSKAVSLDCYDGSCARVIRYFPDCDILCCCERSHVRLTVSPIHSMAHGQTAFLSCPCYAPKYPTVWFMLMWKRPRPARLYSGDGHRTG
jgi:hypothetical protein